MLIKKKSIDYNFGMVGNKVLESVLKQYGIQNDCLLLPFINVNGKCIPLNKRSETSRKTVISQGNELYILKEIPWYCSNKNFVNYVLNLQKQLFVNGLPVPEIIETIQGKLYCEIDYEDEVKYVFLQRYIEGNSWNGSEDKLCEAAKMLGKFHQGIEKSCGQIIAKYNPPKYDVFDIALKMLNTLNEVAIDKQSSIREENMKSLKKFILVYSSKVNEYKKIAYDKGYSNFLIPIHGDYNPWNLIFSKNGSDIVGIIDFDNSIIDNPVHDLVESLLDFCLFTYKPQTTRFQGAPTSLNKKSAKIFLENYYNSVPLSYYDMNKYIGEVSFAVTVELISLGIIRGDYDFSEINQLMFVIDNIEDQISAISTS